MRVWGRTRAGAAGAEQSPCLFRQLALLCSPALHTLLCTAVAISLATRASNQAPTCCLMVKPHCSEMSITYSTAARRCASAVIDCTREASKHKNAYEQPERPSSMVLSRCASAQFATAWPGWTHGRPAASARIATVVRPLFQDQPSWRIKLWPNSSEQGLQPACSPHASRQCCPQAKQLRASPAAHKQCSPQAMQPTCISMVLRSSRGRSRMPGVSMTCVTNKHIQSGTAVGQQGAAEQQRRTAAGWRPGDQQAAQHARQPRLDHSMPGSAGAGDLCALLRRPTNASCSARPAQAGLQSQRVRPAKHRQLRTCQRRYL